MKCTIASCSGEYEDREIVHTLVKDGNVIVFERVPAKVCRVCGDVLLEAATIRRIEVMLKDLGEPARSAPVYDFRKSA